MIRFSIRISKFYSCVESFIRPFTFRGIFIKINLGKIIIPYGENPVLHSNLAKIQPIDNLAPLAKAGIPILHVCSSLDPWFNDNTIVAEKRYKKLGGKMFVIVKKGEGHSSLAPKDSKPVIDFITSNVK
jgi:hypothetical protein